MIYRSFDILTFVCKNIHIEMLGKNPKLIKSMHNCGQNLNFEGKSTILAIIE